MPMPNHDSVAYTLPKSGRKLQLRLDMTAIRRAKRSHGIDAFKIITSMQEGEEPDVLDMFDLVFTATLSEQPDTDMNEFGREFDLRDPDALASAMEPLADLLGSGEIAEAAEPEPTKKPPRSRSRK